MSEQPPTLAYAAPDVEGVRLYQKLYRVALGLALTPQCVGLLILAGYTSADRLLLLTARTMPPM